LSFVVSQKTEAAEFNYWLLLSFTNWDKSDDDDAWWRSAQTV